MTQKIHATRVRYIKLGLGGSWADACIREGTVRIGFGTEKYFDLCQRHEWSALSAAYLADGHSQGTATRFAGEVQTFYEDQGTILWITFHNQKLHWAQIDSSLPAWPAIDGDGTLRKTTGWFDRALNGSDLWMSALSGRLTKTASYRGTSCDIEDPEYIVRRINGERRPEVVEAERLSEELCAVVIGMMRLLTPQDFEVLVDLIFASSGWRRLGPVGNTQKTIDIELELPSTKDRAFIQVKSATTQAEFDVYQLEFEQSKSQKMFYAYHTGQVRSENAGVVLLGPERLARMVLDAGLVSWLTRKVG